MARIGIAVRKVIDEFFMGKEETITCPRCSKEFAWRDVARDKITCPICAETIETPHDPNKGA